MRWRSDQYLKTLTPVEVKSIDALRACPDKIPPEYKVTFDQMSKRLFDRPRAKKMAAEQIIVPTDSKSKANKIVKAFKSFAAKVKHAIRPITREARDAKKAAQQRWRQ